MTAGGLFSRYGAKLYLDQALAKKRILRAQRVAAGGDLLSVGGVVAEG